MVGAPVRAPCLELLERVGLAAELHVGDAERVVCLVVARHVGDPLLFAGHIGQQILARDLRAQPRGVCRILRQHLHQQLTHFVGRLRSEHDAARRRARVVRILGVLS